VRRKGVNCVAVTAWALLGSFDWCSLVTRSDGIYEPGVFDVRSGKPVPTALAEVVKRLGRGEEVHVEGCGWWRQPDRFTFEPVSEREMVSAY
jgi:dTDP-4-dehydrorhamnose reductase